MTIILWMILFVFYLLLCVMDKIFPKNHCLWVRRMKAEYKYNTVWRMILESFLELNISAILNLFYVLYIFIYIYIYIGLH